MADDLSTNQRFSGWTEAPHVDSRVKAGRWQASRRLVTLAILWLFIALVSALDVYCSIKYEYELLAEEMNPIGRWLMHLDGGSVALFIACKFMGNLLALLGLPLLYLLRPAFCVAATAALALVQGLLATMLLGVWG